MAVTLNWGAANAALAESINIYRSTTPIDVANPPAALANIAGNLSSYQDTTAVRNTLYYYMVGHVRLGQELMSPVLTYGHYPDSGPGPQSLIRGDWTLGYFGTCTPAQMFTPTTLNAQVPIPGTLASDASITAWHKFIRKGKILFIPNSFFTSAVQPYQLYNAGLLFGTNDNGSFPFTISSTTLNGYTAPANQYKVATQGAYQFIVRTIKASDKPTSSYVALATEVFPSEWIDLLTRLGNTNNAASPQDKWNDLAGNAGFVGWTQHFSTTGAGYLINLTTTTNLDAANSLNVASGYNNTSSWLPVLELILT